MKRKIKADKRQMREMGRRMKISKLPWDSISDWPEIILQDGPQNEGQDQGSAVILVFSHQIAQASEEGASAPHPNHVGNAVRSDQAEEQRLKGNRIL